MWGKRGGICKINGTRLNTNFTCTLKEMPGHEKKGGKGDPDPDPSPFLIISYEEKQKDLAKVSTK